MSSSSSSPTPTTTTILSLDVGIKNLAYCLMRQTPGAPCPEILQWDTVDLSTAPEEQSPERVAATAPKKCSSCTSRKAVWHKHGHFYCTQHAKQAATTWPIPTPELLPDQVAGAPLTQLQILATQLALPNPVPMKKADLVAAIHLHVQTTFLEPVVVETKKRKRNAADVDLVELGRHLAGHFRRLFGHVTRLDHVIIENQISPIATRMKTLQGMLVQYFVMCGIDVGNMEFISAANKLKVPMPLSATPVEQNRKGKAKPTYGDRKKRGIEVCQAWVTHSQVPEMQARFASHTKKDDLADAFLQGMWFLTRKTT